MALVQSCLWLCVRGAKHCAVAASSRWLFLLREFACGASIIDGRVAHGTHGPLIYAMAERRFVINRNRLPKQPGRARA